MAANLWKVGTSNAFSTTLNGNIASGDLSIVLTSATGLQAPGVVVIDRVDTNSVATPTLREYVSFTGISTNTLTGCSRALGGSTAQAHNSGAKVEECLSVDHWNDQRTALLNILTTAGALDTTKVVDLTTAQTLTNKTLTAPVITNENRTTDFRARVSLGSAQSINSGSATKIQFGSESYDPNSNFDAVTNYRYTCPHNGIYLINARASYTSTTDGSFYTIDIYTNGSVTAYGTRVVSGGTSEVAVMACAILSLSASDYIEVFANHNHGSAVALIAGPAITFLEVFQLSRG